MIDADGVPADEFEFSWEVLARAAPRVVNEVWDVNRVVYDVTGKPPVILVFWMCYVEHRPAGRD